jgi:phytoene desaturase
VRTVRGATDSVVVVGAGLGGLSAALRLAAAGRSVTVLEREAVPGGRAGLVSDGGYAFDTGPMVLTMPDLLADALGCVGEDLRDWLDLRPVDPLYRATFPDGSRLHVRADVDAMAEEIAGVCGRREADGYRRFVDFVSELYRLQIRDFIDRNLDSPRDVLTPALARLAAIGGFRTLAGTVASYLSDPRTRRVFSFQAMYAGLSPFDARALYAVIAYMDSVAGVFFPRGGMHAVPRALAGAAEKHGVEIRYGVEVTAVERSPHDRRRAVAVRTASGERIPADVVVLNPDLPVARRELLGLRGDRLRRLRYSPSCFLLLAGSRTRHPEPVHHTISFGHAWRQVFRELVDQGRLMTDPSFLVSAPTVTDPSLAPAGREIYYVLFPTPNLDARLDWSRLGPRYRDVVLDLVERRGWPGFAEGIEVEHLTTPLDWARRGMERGAPFAAAHTLRQTGPFRPGNIWGENVVFTGSGTVPGVGVPMVLISGRLAAERIVGVDPAYRSGAWPVGATGR